MKQEIDANRKCVIEESIITPHNHLASTFHKYSPGKCVIVRAGSCWGLVHRSSPIYWMECYYDNIRLVVV